jgi:hypothetical protein
MGQMSTSSKACAQPPSECSQQSVDPCPLGARLALHAPPPLPADVVDPHPAAADPSPLCPDLPLHHPLGLMRLRHGSSHQRLGR